MQVSQMLFVQYVKDTHKVHVLLCTLAAAAREHARKRAITSNLADDKDEHTANESWDAAEEKGKLDA